MLKFTVSSFISQIFDGDVQVHAFIASPTQIKESARSVVELSIPQSGRSKEQNGQLNLQSAKWAALVLELHVEVPNYENMPSIQQQGFAIIDLSKSEDSCSVSFLSVNMEKGDESAYCSLKLQYTVDGVTFKSACPTPSSKQQLNKQHTQLLEEYMESVSGMHTVENDVHETTRISTFFTNGRIMPSWVFWQNIEKTCIQDSDIETWAQVALQSIPGNEVSSFDDLVQLSQQHLDFLQLLVGMPVVSTRYSDDVIVVPSNKGGLRSKGLYVADVDTYSMSTSGSSGDCEDRVRTILNEVFKALCSYAARHKGSKLGSLLSPLQKYKPFAALVTQSTAIGASRWSHYICVLMRRDGFEGGVFRHSGIRETLPSVLVLDSVYPSVTRFGVNSLVHVAKVTESMKQNYHSTTMKKEWPSVVIRPPFFFDNKTLQQFVVMRLFSVVENSTDAHSIVPETTDGGGNSLAYGISLFKLVHSNFPYKEVHANNLDEQMQQLIWRHPPVRFQPSPIQPPPAHKTLQRNSVAIIVSPGEEESKVSEVLSKNGTILWKQQWTADAKRDLSGVSIIRWTPEH